MRRLVLPCLVIGALSGVALARFADVPQLLYPSNRTGNNEICLLNADGSASKNLTESKASNTDPAWSPDGTKIAFVSDRNGTRDIYLMDADGKNVKQLTTDKGENRGPAWSPDGKKIAFQHTGQGEETGSLYIMDADGSNAKEILKGEGPTEGGRPAWKPK